MWQKSFSESKKSNLILSQKKFLGAAVGRGLLIKIMRREDMFGVDGFKSYFYEVVSLGLHGRLLWTRSHKEKTKLAEMNSLYLLCGLLFAKNEPRPMNLRHWGLQSRNEPKSQTGEINTLFTKMSPKKIESIAGYIFLYLFLCLGWYLFMYVIVLSK